MLKKILGSLFLMLILSTGVLALTGGYENNTPYLRFDISKEMAFDFGLSGFQDINKTDNDRYINSFIRLENQIAKMGDIKLSLAGQLSAQFYNFTDENSQDIILAVLLTGEYLVTKQIGFYTNLIIISYNSDDNDKDKYLDFFQTIGNSILTGVRVYF